MHCDERDISNFFVYSQQLPGIVTLYMKYWLKLTLPRQICRAIIQLSYTLHNAEFGSELNVCTLNDITVMHIAALAAGVVIPMNLLAFSSWCSH